MATDSLMTVPPMRKRRRVGLLVSDMMNSLFWLRGMVKGLNGDLNGGKLIAAYPDIMIPIGTFQPQAQPCLARVNLDNTAYVERH